MKSALQRELDALGWRALGFLLGLLVLVVGGILWGASIDARLDSVEVDRDRDHQTLDQLVGAAEVVQAPAVAAPSSSAVPAPAQEEGAVADVDDVNSTGGSPAPPPHHQGEQEEPKGEQTTGSPAGSPPAEAPLAAPPSTTSPQSSPSPESAPGTEERSPSVLETAGGAVGEVVDGAGEVVQSTTCGLTAPLLCPK